MGIFCCDYWLIGLTVVLIYCVYWVVKFLRADADLNLLSHSLKPGFFKGKVVWVTGASSGIGEELCRQLSTLGAKVILSARSKDKLEEVAKSLSHPEYSKVLVVDLADQENVASASDKAKELFGRIDILVNNGGVSARSSFLDFEEKAARRLMETNFFGTVSITRDVVKLMAKQGGGNIVNISSVAGKAGFIYRHYYSASKFALIGLMDCLRYEVQDKNISITNVCPGPIRTNVSINALKSDGSKFGKMDNMIGNGMPVERCAELILIATCNMIREVWISRHPALIATYLSQYFPSIAFFLVKRRMREMQKDVTQTLDDRKKQ